MTTERQWLSILSWQDIVDINKSLCKTDVTPHGPGQGFAETQKLWKESTDKTLKLRKALEICRRCHSLSPFSFFNGNTFAVVMSRMLEGVMSGLSSVEAHILRNTMAHYVAGAIKASELEAVLDHFEKHPRR